MGSDPMDEYNLSTQQFSIGLGRRLGGDIKADAAAGRGAMILHFRFLVRVTSCVILRTARFSSIVVFVDSVERLSPISAASL